MIPAALSYLQVACDDLEATDPHRVNEDLDTTLICNALKERVSGLTDQTAIALLRSDKSALDDWLLSNADSNCHFLSAFLAEPDALVGYLRNYKPKKRRAKALKAPRRRLEIEVPVGFTCRKEGGGLFLESTSNRYGISTLRGMTQKELLHLATGHFAVKAEPVAFGAIRGFRIVREELTRSFALKLDGKDITAYVDGDPAPLESVLHTLHYVDPGAAV